MEEASQVSPNIITLRPARAGNRTSSARMVSPEGISKDSPGRIALMSLYTFFGNVVHEATNSQKSVYSGALL